MRKLKRIDALLALGLVTAACVVVISRATPATLAETASGSMSTSPAASSAGDSISSLDQLKEAALEWTNHRGLVVRGTPEVIHAQWTTEADLVATLDVAPLNINQPLGLAVVRGDFDTAKLRGGLIKPGGVLPADHLIYVFGLADGHPYSIMGEDTNRTENSDSIVQRALNLPQRITEPPVISQLPPATIVPECRPDACGNNSNTNPAVKPTATRLDK